MLIQKKSIILLSLILLASCGGGGSLGDGTTQLTTYPSKITFTSSNCGFIEGNTVTVVGGIAPYRLVNPLPQSISLSTDSVTNAGEGFKINATGGCFSNQSILIIDSDANIFELSATYAQSN